MHTSVRPFATAGIALVGASVISVSPLTPSAPEIRTVEAETTLAAASIFNVPANLINAFLNMPAAGIAGIERFAAAMEASGSWNESHPNNVWGWDPVNPEHAKGMTDMFIPFPALSNPLGEHINWWMAANLPMHEGCAFSCPDLAGMLNKMFRVPMWEFWDEDGYTFPVVINPIDGKETEWSEKQVILDPWEPVKSVITYLLADPGEVTFPTAYETITAFANLASALQTTGHLPSWIAVREIETFFKLFVPKPEMTEESVETTTVPETAEGDITTEAPEQFRMPQLDTARLVSLETAVTPADTDAPEELGAGAAEGAAAQTGPVESVDVAEDAEESADAEGEVVESEGTEAADKPLTVQAIKDRLAAEASGEQGADETVADEEAALSDDDGSDDADKDADTTDKDADKGGDESAGADSGKTDSGKTDSGDKGDSADD